MVYIMETVHLFLLFLLVNLWFYLLKLLAPHHYSNVVFISVQTGSGSTGRKKSLILNLMRSCREKEMKFLVRTLVTQQSTLIIYFYLFWVHMHILFG